MTNGIRNLKISFKLYIFVGVALIGMLIIGGMSFFLLNRMNDKTSDITSSWLPSVDVAREMDTTISNVRLNELAYLTADSDEMAEQSLTYVNKEKQDMEDLLTKYGSLIDTEEQEYYENLKSFWTQYSADDDNLMELAGEGKIKQARAILDGECVELYVSLQSTINDIIAYNAEGSDAVSAESKTLYNISLAAMAVIMIVIIIIGVLFSYVIIRGIKLPIFEIENAAVKMAQGNLDAEISYTSKDELGVLSDQMRELIRKLRAIIDDENEFLAKMASGILMWIPYVSMSMWGDSTHCWCPSAALQRSLMTRCCRSATVRPRLLMVPSRYPAELRRCPRELRSRLVRFRSWLPRSLIFPRRLRRMRRMRTRPARWRTRWEVRWRQATRRCMA